ncbi:hypothetical protein HGP14_30530 [Rhizobium sp. P32RR-XVIII]|uniref:hypothetical protein n=1 Tax=Rhizobium sp. P32RR-XVIII TaxID=2726738 RepID=UPI0014563C22|nr:hypothetical protein [Rhizobium sp. P32RR-XVIII]NLS07602.1 hypothetical protein [Rhizobium sp. P32RR-XVIII]
MTKTDPRRLLLAANVLFKDEAAKAISSGFAHEPDADVIIAEALEIWLKEQCGVTTDDAAALEVAAGKCGLERLGLQVSERVSDYVAAAAFKWMTRYLQPELCILVAAPTSASEAPAPAAPQPLA